MGVQWTDSYPCIESYDVILKGANNDDTVETVLVKEQTGESKLMSLQFMKLLEEKENFELKQCSNYQISVHPKLKSFHPQDNRPSRTTQDVGDWESGNGKTEQLFYFTHPEPPDDLAHEDLDDESALVTWHHLTCHKGSFRYEELKTFS